MSQDIIELAMKNNCVSQGLFQLKMDHNQDSILI